MVQPDNFSSAEHLQDTIRRVFRREVREWFRDVDLDGDLDISVSRQSLALACEHKDEDSLLMTLERILLFETLRGRFSERLLGNGLDEVGVSQFKPTVQRRLKPQIVLQFIEDVTDVEAGYTPVFGRISFRLMDYDASSMNPSIATTYANRIKTAFATGGGFVWRKGREMCSYTDWDKGYQLQLYCRTEAEGRRVVEQVLDIQQDVPDWSLFNHDVSGEPATAYPTVPQVKTVYGKSRRLSRVRPVADVRFQWAKMVVAGLKNPILLVDRSGILTNPLVS